MEPRGCCGEMTAYDECKLSYGSTSDLDFLLHRSSIRVMSDEVFTGISHESLKIYFIGNILCCHRLLLHFSR